MPPGRAKKFGQATLPNLFFRDGILSIPGYTFEMATPWSDTGSMTQLAEGHSLKDGSSVLAKIAPSHSNGSMILEREAHILENMTYSPDAATAALSFIDYFVIPRSKGDCSVLLVAHPGVNHLARYFPNSRINDMLLSSIPRPRSSSSRSDVFMASIDDTVALYDDNCDAMDLASFLEFAIQATHCLQMAHQLGVTHREVRANAFHIADHTGRVRLVHFGNRAISLEQYGGPSTLVIGAERLDEGDRLRIKEALCYLAPEQTGAYDVSTEDHRTDLYSLGVLFWSLIVGRGALPFEGHPLEILHHIVQKRPNPVHEVRRDIPQVLASIIDKLMTKSPDGRYQSCVGLKADLLECQRLLMISVNSRIDTEISDLIPTFPIAGQDRFMHFTIPNQLFGREKELEIIRNVIRHTSTSYSRHYGVMYGHHPTASSGSSPTPAREKSMDSLSANMEELEDKSDKSGASTGGASTPSADETSNSRLSVGRPLMSNPSLSSSPTAASATPSAPLGTNDSLRRVTLASTKTRSSRVHSIIIQGPAGAGKSSLILANQSRWRSYGLWGFSKFKSGETTPFAALTSCLSSVLRQLMLFSSDLQRFVEGLKNELGPQLHNIPLLYEGAPVLRHILSLFGIVIDSPHEDLSSTELRARFQALVVDVFFVLARTRILALVLDDLHEADDPSLDLIRTLANSRGRMIIFTTVRKDSEFYQRAQTIFTSKTRATWIDVDVINHSAVANMVSRTLHRPREECSPLSMLIHAVSHGNPFSARSFLHGLQRQHHVFYEWSRNVWEYDLSTIESSLVDNNLPTDPTTPEFLMAHFKELPEEARKYLLWASLFGSTFKVKEVNFMMHWESNHSSLSEGSDESRGDRHDVQSVSSIRSQMQEGSGRESMRGLQIAITEGWLVTRARDTVQFSHDRYRQAAEAAAAKLPPDELAQMSYRIILMLLGDPAPSVHLISQHVHKCLHLVRTSSRRSEVISLLVEAGESAWAKGAHETALTNLEKVRILAGDDLWDSEADLAQRLYPRLAELYTWKGDVIQSNYLVRECLGRTKSSELKASLIRIRSRNLWLRSEFQAALEDMLRVCECLGVDMNSNPSTEEIDVLHEQVKNEILAVGFDEILALPRSNDPRHVLISSVLIDAGTCAYWTHNQDLVEIMALMCIQMTLRLGISSSSGLGFLWLAAGTAERRHMYRFSTDLGRLGMRLSLRYGSNHDKCQAQVLYTGLVAGYDHEHYSCNLLPMMDAVKCGLAAGDRQYAAFGLSHKIMIRLFMCDHLDDVIISAEEAVNDIQLWLPGSGPVVPIQGLINCIRAIGGYTRHDSPATAFDTDTFQEADFLQSLRKSSIDTPLTMNWYNAFKVVALFCIGFISEAAELGFEVYHTAHLHPNHRHTRYSAFFHVLALIACLRRDDLGADRRARYIEQVRVNQVYINRWLSSSSVNTTMWAALIEAEIAALENNQEAFKLYDEAVKLAIRNGWIMEEAWAMFLQGSHFLRCGMDWLGSDLQRRGILRHSQWGARGITRYLSTLLQGEDAEPSKKSNFTAEVAVQTDHATTEAQVVTDGHISSSGEEDEYTSLTAADLSSILKWSQEVSKDISLSSALKRLIEIAIDSSGAQFCCIVIAREGGDYGVAATMMPPQACQLYDSHKPIRSLTDPLQPAVLSQTLNHKERFYFDDVSTDPRFASEAAVSPHRSVLSLPIFSNRGQTFGAIYLASKYGISRKTASTLTLLCQQVSISIANALLFRSVQSGTRENLKMIASQKEALDLARLHREEAEKATKIKSNFLASMSHELRTPFSSFYGLLDILDGTELSQGQREIVQTAKQSCELLLRIIDSILDYSKLEASAVKLEFSSFPVENIIADCMELLLPSAARKLDLSFNIDANVPPWVTSDYARIRQILMNLIGNAVKFTASGTVKVNCSMDMHEDSAPGEVRLKFIIEDTGIGMSQSDVEALFTPFRQADNSSTRKFGGTGLGLSISRQLVKLMGGAIGVQSWLNSGSQFWFTIPVKRYDGPDAREALSEVQTLKMEMLKPQPLRVVIVSPSDATRTMLCTMLSGFFTLPLTSLDEAFTFLRDPSNLAPVIDFMLFDDQSDARVEELAHLLHTYNPALRGIQVLHLYTPTTDALTAGTTTFNSSIEGVTKVTKPPRQARLLQIMAGLKNIPVATTGVGPPTEVGKAIGNLAAARRMLFGNVLIAEDNPVAQKLVIKQLERYQLNVTATSNGQEAIDEWNAHEPGYFSVALFDHHMPVCDGVDAARRIRQLENQRKVETLLPIVALSADAQESTKQLCLSNGFNAFFSKPLKKGDLISLLSTFGTGSEDLPMS